MPIECISIKKQPASMLACATLLLQCGQLKCWWGESWITGGYCINKKMGFHLCENLMYNFYGKEKEKDGNFVLNLHVFGITASCAAGR